MRELVEPAKPSHVLAHSPSFTDPYRDLVTTHKAPDPFSPTGGARGVSNDF